MKTLEEKLERFWTLWEHNLCANSKWRIKYSLESVNRNRKKYLECHKTNASACALKHRLNSLQSQNIQNYTTKMGRYRLVCRSLLFWNFICAIFHSFLLRSEYICKLIIILWVSLFLDLLQKGHDLTSEDEKKKKHVKILPIHGTLFNECCVVFFFDWIEFGVIWIIWR